MRINTQADMVKILRSEAKKAGTNISEAGATRMLEHAIASSLDPAKALKVALDGLRVPASVAKTLTAFIDGARASETRPKPVTVATQKALKEAFKAEKAALQFKNPAEALPMGARFVRVEIARDNHVDGFTYTALIPVGALAPGAKPTDPNQAQSVFIERSGGIAGLTQIAGPLDLTPQATNGRELRTLLEKNDDAMGALVSHAWPEGYAKSTPPQLKKVSKRADGNFDVTMALVNWRTGKVSDENTLTVKPNGKLAEVTIGGGTQQGISADTVRDMISTLNKTMSTLDWKREDALPVGVRYVRVDLYSERHPDGFGYTALVPAGALRPGVEPDLTNVTSFFVERTGGFAGMTRVAGPITIEQSDGGGRVTTMAVGEEGGDGGGRVTTMAVGEEGGDGGGRATTMAVGEEGGDGGGRVTTMAVGEEGGDGGGRVTTMAVGEEGGDGGVGSQEAKVEKLWTKIQTVHGRLTEELRTEDAIRRLDVIDGKVVAMWDPRGPFTQNQVKAFMTQALKDAGITLPLVLERDQIMTTMAVGEEGQGGVGGGTVTTLAVGEEGGDGGQVTTAAIGEEGGGGAVTLAIPESPDGGDGGGRVTTMAVGEEGQDPIGGGGGGRATTLAMGEEGQGGFGGGGGRATTMAVGEEGQGFGGGRGGITTEAVGEES